MNGTTNRNGDYAVLILRLLLGSVFFAHGAQKVFGLFGGAGLQGTLDAFTRSMHIPYLLAVVAIATEFFGSIALIFGFLTRIAALLIGIEMFVAAILVHWQNGFFMNWYGAQKGEGFEYHLLAIAVSVALVILGGGAFSIDRKLFK